MQQTATCGARRKRPERPTALLGFAQRGRVEKGDIHTIPKSPKLNPQSVPRAAARKYSGRVPHDVPEMYGNGGLGPGDPDYETSSSELHDQVSCNAPITPTFRQLPDVK